MLEEPGGHAALRTGEVYQQVRERWFWYTIGTPIGIVRAPHEAVWHDIGAGDEEWGDQRTYRFRLLRLVDADDGTAVTATDEAIVLYLQALNTDLADRAMALTLLVEVQMRAGEFDKALQTARQATRTANGLAASLREKLDDTRRDVRAVD